MRKPDRPKHPILRCWNVEFEDGVVVEVEAEYRGAARHYAKSCRDELVGSRRHYQRVKSAKLVRGEAA